MKKAVEVIFVHVKYSSASMEEIFSATLPVGILVNSSVFPQEDRFVEVVFKNKRVPAMCI